MGTKPIFFFGRLETKENEWKEESLKEETMRKLKERKETAREKDEGIMIAKNKEKKFWGEEKDFDTKCALWKLAITCFCSFLFN
jgi:hypothetical protein